MTCKECDRFLSDKDLAVDPTGTYCHKCLSKNWDDDLIGTEEDLEC